MAENKKQSTEPRDYKERFEFVLTVGDNIICQRYFRINSFNPASLYSYELTEAIRSCVAAIDNDLRDKSQTYSEIYAPKTFNSVEEMEAFVANPANKWRLSFGEGLVVRGNKTTDYVYTNKGVVVPLNSKFDDGELTDADIQANVATYKFAFKVDGREVSSMIWEGYYPKFVRDKIDLSNKRGKFEDFDISRLSFEQYLLHKMVRGKNDLVYGLIKSICYACSYPDSKSYTTDADSILEAWNADSQKILWRAL